MKKEKLYICVGYSFATNNPHLLGTVGQIHTLHEWIKIAYPYNPYADSFFEGCSDSYIIKYLLDNMRIRLEWHR